jgi:glucose/arabinose dehydrogenase
MAVDDNTKPEGAQSLNATLGKMLRINKEGAIPTDNSFVNVTEGNN